MRWKEYLEYEKNRDTNVKKIYNKLGMDIDTVTKNSEAQLYTPNKDSNKDVSMWLTRNNKDEEAERVKKLQEISDRNKANIDKVVAESKTKKAGTSNSAGLNPLESENNASKGNKKGLGQIAHDFFIGGIDDDGNDKFMKLFGVDWKAPESQINYQKSQQAKKDSVSNVLNKHGYLEKGSTDEEANEYYSNVMKDMGYSDEDINKSLGFGGEVALNKGFLGKVNSSIRNAVAPGADDVMQMVVNENERNRGSKFGNFASGLVGNIIGLAMNPGGGTAQGTTLLNAADGFAEGVASKVAPKLGNSIAGKVGTNAIRGAVDGGVGGVLDTLRGDDSENLASNVVNGALGGALMFGGQKALGEVKNSIGGNIDGKFNALFDDMDGFVKGVDTDNVNYTGLKTPFSEVKVETNGAKVKNKVPVFEEVNIDDGKVYVEAMDSETPKRFDNAVKISDEVVADKVEMDSPIGNSRFANVTHQNKHDVPIEYKQAVEKLETSYNIGNNKTDNAAAKEVVEGDSNSLAKWFNGGFESLDKGMDTHIGMELAKKALADGDVNTYSEIVSKLSEKASKNGQDIQALAFYNSQTPEGMAASVTKNIRKIQDDVLNGKGAKVREQFDIAKSEMNEEQLIEFCKKNKIPYLDSEQLSNVQDIQKQILAATDEKEIIRLTALRNKEISKNIPKSTLSKVNDYRYKSMLFNPKTLLSRNPIASLTRMGTDAIGNPLGVALDKLASNKTGLRTRFGNDFSQAGNVIKNSIDDMNFDFKNGVNTSDGNMYGIDFNGGSDKLSDKAFKWAMELGDRPFADTVENAQLLGYMKEMGITDIKDVPSEMRELFKLRGKENNFQNKHYATDWVNKGKRIPVIGQLLDSTMPFVNTNLNLLQDTVERSPVGLAKGIYDYSKVLRGKTGTDVLGAQKKAVDEITKGAVGLGTTALGYALADNLTGNYSNDSKVKAVQQDMGMRENALKIGDYNFDLSQLSTLMPNMVLGKHLKDNGLSSTSVGNGIGQQIETAIKSSPFSGLTNFTDDMSEHGFQTAVTNLVGNYANQYVPTIIKQTNNLLDPLRRDTYDENPLKRQINNIVSGVPGLSLTLDSQHNTLGEDKLKYPNMEDGEVVFNSYLNPFLTSKAGGDNYEQLQRILNVANEAGDSDHIPSRYSKRFNYTTTGGDRISYNLSNDELAEWKRLYAKYSKNAKSQKQFEEALEKANDDMRAKVKPRNAKK